MNTNHLTMCKAVTDAIGAMWTRATQDGTPIGVRLARLASVISHSNSGRLGAGLTGGTQQEELFRDMLVSGDKRFTATSEHAQTDADYYFSGYPLSHKTIGYNGAGDLALAWSKNPEGGLQRTQFASSMVIMSFRQPATKGKWCGMDTGAYVVPLDYLTTNVRFASNNKTDSLIKSRDVIAAMRFARREGTFLPLAYRHDAGAGLRVSLWASGAAPGIPPLDL